MPQNYRLRDIQIAQTRYDYIDGVLLLNMIQWLYTSHIPKWAWSKGYYWHSKVWFSTWSSPWNRQWRKTNYNKHDDLTSPKVGKLLFISSNISAAPEYRMEFTFHNSFIIYSSLGLVSSTVISFLTKAQLLTLILLKQGYIAPRSKSCY